MRTIKIQRWMYLSMILVFLICTAQTCTPSEKKYTPTAIKLLSVKQQLTENKCRNNPCDTYSTKCKNQGKLSGEQRKECDDLEKRCDECPKLEQSERKLANANIGLSENDTIGVGCLICPPMLKLLMNTELTDDVTLQVFNSDNQKLIATRTNNSNPINKKLILSFASKGLTLNLHDKSTKTDFPIKYRPNATNLGI